MALFLLEELPQTLFDASREYILPGYTGAANPSTPQPPLGAETLSSGVEWRVYWAQMQAPPGAVAGTALKYWNGSSHVVKPLKYWDSAAWTTKPLKRWSGAAWV